MKPRSTSEKRPVANDQHGDAVGSIAVEIDWGCPVERRILAVEQGDGNAFAIVCNGKEAARNVVVRVVAGGDLLAFAQNAAARLHVVVVGLRGRRHGRIGEAQVDRVELVAAHHAKRIGFFLEGDIVLFAVREAAHDDTRQAVLPFKAYQMIAGNVRVDD